MPASSARPAVWVAQTTRFPGSQLRRRETLGLRWLTASSRSRGEEKIMAQRLAAEIMDAASNTG